MLRLAKNKIDLQSTVPNYIVTHRNIGNFRVLNAELFNKQIVSLYNRLNDKSKICKITKIRMWQEHRIAGITEELEVGNEYTNIKKLWKYNQAMLVLLKAAKSKITIIPLQSSWKISNIGRTIRSMLEDKMFVQYAKSLEALNLVFIEQLLSIEGDQMITWCYLK